MEIERHFWRLRFQVRFLRAVGTEFQKFVQQIMELRFSDEFVPVRPAGSEGDRKCDGLLTAQRRLLQVYAPERFDKRRALNKIDEDYFGAVAHWGDAFDTWMLVHNSMDGLPPYIVSKLNDLSQSCGTRHVCDHWGYAKLRQFAFELDHDELTELLGPSISLINVLDIEVSDIIPLIKHIQDTSPAPLMAVGPVPEDKLNRNNLSSDVEALLTVGMRRSDEVARYFRGQTMRPLYRDDLGARFKRQYLFLRDEGLQPDIIFSQIVDWITGPGRTPSSQAAALAIAAYFFEQCDIFEDPLSA